MLKLSYISKTDMERLTIMKPYLIKNQTKYLFNIVYGNSYNFLFRNVFLTFSSKNIADTVFSEFF